MTDTRADNTMMYWIAVAAPLLGDHALIIMSALAGAMWPLSTRESTSRLDAGFFLLRLVCTASVLTGIIAQIIEQKFGYHSQEVISPVAFCIGAVGDRWRTLIADCVNYVRDFLNRKGRNDAGNSRK